MSKNTTIGKRGRIIILTKISDVIVQISDVIFPHFHYCNQFPCSNIKDVLIKGIDILKMNSLFQTQKKGWTGPILGVKVASENKRNFDQDVLKVIF